LQDLSLSLFLITQSQSPSDASDRDLHGESMYLSPNHVSQPLPPSAPTRPSHVQQQRQQHAPVIPTSTTSEGRRVLNLPDGKLPPGFMPIGPPTPLSSGVPLPGSSAPPMNSKQPLLGTWDYTTSQSSQPSQLRSDRRESSSRSSHREGPESLSGRQRQQATTTGPSRQIYGPAPTPQTYPPPSGGQYYSNPGQSRPQGSDTPQSQASRPGYSLGLGTSPAAQNQELPADSGRILLRKVSESSLGSEFSHYDPNSHADPAYFPPNRSVPTPGPRARAASSASSMSYPTQPSRKR
jgi:hypothetical protein